MMKKCLLILSLLSVTMFARAEQTSQQVGPAIEAKPFKATLRGTVHDRPDAKYLYIMNIADRDMNINRARVIPLRPDGKFEYEFSGDNLLAFELTVLEDLQNASWRPVIFFPDSSVVEFEIFPRDAEYLKDKVYGGALNRQLYAYKHKENELFSHKELYDKINALGEERETYYNPEFIELEEQIVAEMDRAKVAAMREKLMAMMNDGSAYSAEVNRVQEEIKKLDARQYKWKYEYLSENPGHVAYALLINDLFYNQAVELDDYERLYGKLRAALPGHPYTERIGLMISGRRILPGNKYIDFTAPEIDGTMHTLSKEIEGKIAVINLWASWCGPCIDHSRLLMPVYEKYKDKGFTVVACAREFKDTDDYVNILELENYPWLNLFDVDDKIGVSLRYGQASGSGKIVLVDREGTIVYVDPTAEQVDKYLAENL